jgi:hypothetical protein
MNWATWVIGTPSLHAILERFLFRIYHEHVQDGITIYADKADGPVDQVHERIAAAFRLIDRLDPARARRMRTLLPNIMVLARVPTQFWAGTKTCVVDRNFLDTASDAYLACALVHEAAHARLRRRGIGSTPRSVGRVEAVCIRDEIAFLKRLPRDEYPGTDRLIEYLANLAAAGVRENR